MECMLNGPLLEQEAGAVLNELPFSVDHIALSDKLPRSDQRVYLNITTCEHESYCLELTTNGWRVVSTRHDHIDEQQLDNNGLRERYFETVYQLLDFISPIYRQRFASKLISELSSLNTVEDRSS
ncbi:unnamed protein product [Toxocara canis]|nr:unnamed protein product [Toxocara canis]